MKENGDDENDDDATRKGEDERPEKFSFALGTRQ